jgi:8-oxo-dGTP pyrophosphatase MutT (NUDIX family)
MYKVFFNDRKLILTDNFTKHFQVNFGLFYKYRDLEDLKEIISLYNKLTKIETLYLFHHDIDKLREDFRLCFTFLPAAGGLVKNLKDEYLLIFRRGKWDLPKGKLDRNESFEDAAIREVEEECGIHDLKIVRPLLSTYHTYDLKGELALKKTSWYEMLYKGNEKPIPETSEDIHEVKWVKPDQLEKYLNGSFPAIRDVFTSFGV